MPTIDQLAPATAATDNDALLVSQAGIARKITRAQILAGVQPQLNIASGTVLGRASNGVGTPEVLTVGQNLSVSGGTLAATAAPFLVSQLPAGVVPAPTDLVSIGQGGTNAAVTYAQFMNGVAGVTTVDVSQAYVTPTGTKGSSKLADLIPTLLPVSGGTMSGPLTLAAAPATASQAATKAYVDTQIATTLPRSGGTLAGPLVLASDPTQATMSATKNYVDLQVGTTLPRSGGTLTGSLTLNGDPLLPLQAATKQYTDTRLQRSGDTLSGVLTLAADPATAMQAATKNYVDTQLASTLLKTGASLTGALVLATDPSTGLQAATKQYVDARLLRSGDTLSGALILSADPVSAMSAANKGYVDTQVSTALPRTGGTVSGAIGLPGDPTTSLQAATKQYVDTRLVRSGDTLTGPLLLAADPTTALQAATKGYVDTKAAAALPQAGGTLTGSLTLGGDPAAPLQAATKRYVDLQLQAALPTTGGTLTGALVLAGVPTTANQASSKQYVDTQLATALSLSGGTLTGPLSLPGMPTATTHAATKQYVDRNPGPSGVIEVKLPPYNAKIDGVTDDTAAFAAAYQAATSGGIIHVPAGAVVLQSPSNWGVPLTKSVKWIVDATTLTDGTPLASAIPTGGAPSAFTLPGVVIGNSNSAIEISKGTSQSSDLAVLHSSYVVNHTGGPVNGVVTNTRNDTLIYNSPNSYVWGGLDRLLWVGTQTPVAASPAQHVARYMQTIRQSIATDSGGKPLPQPEMWSACLEYRDTTGKPSSWTNNSIVAEMDWIGNGADDGNKRQIQSLVVAQHDPSGAPVGISSVIGIYLGGGSVGSADKVLNVGIPFTTAVLDTTASQQLGGAAAIRMAAGHAIAFDSSNSNRLAFDSATGTLRWNQGTLSYVVGKGISVGWQNVCSGNTSLPAYLAGNIVFLVGSGSYTVTLPAASGVAPGTGFTFSALGSALVSIVPSGTDSIDQAPIVLRPADRYHIVSDGGSAWREVFRTNAYSPKFSGPPVLPSFAVAALPASPGAGAKAFATNGRKPNEVAGAGTGVEVFNDGQRWIAGCTGAAVTS